MTTTLKPLAMRALFVLAALVLFVGGCFVIAVLSNLLVEDAALTNGVALFVGFFWGIAALWLSVIAWDGMFR